MIFKVCLCLVTPLLAATALADQRIDRRAPADANGAIEISVPNGHIAVRASDQNEVHLTGRMDDDATLEFSTQGGRTVIRVAHRGGRFTRGDTDIEVSVPTRNGVNVMTTSADMHIQGVRGAQELRSVSGEIDTEFWQEDLDIHTVSGNVRARGHNVKSVADITTVSGDAELWDAQGEVNGGTVSGNLRLKLGALTRGRFSTTSGDISITATLVKDARVDIEATSGDVELRLQPPVNAQFDVATFSGDIDNCFGPKPREPEHGPGANLYFTAGDGSARVKAKTLSGDVKVCDK
jgi:DUF4097 and DUF4098 domain-containing protein YvlB